MPFGLPDNPVTFRVLLFSETLNPFSMSNGYANILPRPSNPKESSLVQYLIIGSSLFCIAAMTFYNKTVEARPDSLKQYTTVSPIQPHDISSVAAVEADVPPAKMNWFFTGKISDAGSPVRFEFDQLSTTIAYTLDFGDGQKTAVTEKMVNHIYRQTGRFKAKLTAVHKGVSRQLQTSDVHVVEAIEVDEVSMIK